MNKLRILYGIQCTGNGHLTRSREIIKYLEHNYNVDVDVCLSGNFSQVDTNDINVVYKFEGLSFNLEKGGISIINTLKNAKILDFMRSVIKIDLSVYDIIVSDFEPIICWSGMLRRRNILGVGNHFKFLSNKRFLNNLKPNFFWNKIVTKLVSPVDSHISFDYFKESDGDFFPIIRETIRRVKLKEEDHYLVYLSSISISDQIKFFNLFPNHIFYIYHNGVDSAYDFENIRMRPIDKTKFTEKLIKSKGVICHTGFQLTSECLFLGKKLFVIPIKNQIEQIYNTKQLEKFGVLTSDKLDIKVFDDFFENDYSVRLNYIDEMAKICDRIVEYRS